MTEISRAIDPCTGCSYGKARQQGMKEANTVLEGQIAKVFDDPDSSRLGTQGESLTHVERALGNMGNLIDRVAEITSCKGRKSGDKGDRFAFPVFFCPLR